MANNFIPIDTSKWRGVFAFQTSTSLQGALDSLQTVKAAMDNMITGVDYSIVEAQFGLPTGKGQTFYNLVSGTVADLGASVNLAELISWLGVLRGV